VGKNYIDVADTSLLRAAVDGMIDEVAERCGHMETLPVMKADAERIRQMIGAMEIAARFNEPQLADHLYVSVQRQILRLARSCAVAE
jgi:hypothetical protein